MSGCLLLTKYAEFKVIEAGRGILRPERPRSFRYHAHKVEFDYTPHQGYIYVRSRAISSRCNDNFDEFPAQEIREAYQTFIGKPVFVNHHNDDHRNSRGVIIDAVLHEDVNPDGSDDTWVEVLMEIDAVRYPKLAEAILKGHIDRTSMGTDVEYSVCSVCGNKATTPLDYCSHIPKMKGQKVWRTTASGEKVPILVREICYGLRFFENSLLVEDPADPTAYFLDVDDRGVGGGYEGGLTSAAARILKDLPGGGSHGDRGSRHPRLRGHDRRGDRRRLDPGRQLLATRASRRPASRERSVRGLGSRLIQAAGGRYPYVGSKTRKQHSKLDPDQRQIVTRMVKDIASGSLPVKHLAGQRNLYRAERGTRPRMIVVLADHGDHDEIIWVGTHEDANKSIYSRGSAMRRAATHRRHAYGETITPPEVDTLRDEACPVCGDEDFNGAQCKTCGYEPPPEEFRDPDLHKHREVDLHDGYVPDEDREPSAEDDEVPETALGDSTPAFEDAEPGAAVPEPGEYDDESVEEQPEADEDEGEGLEQLVEEDQALLSEVIDVLDQVSDMLSPDDVPARVEDEARQRLDEIHDLLGDEVAPPDVSEDESEDEDSDDDLPEFLTDDDDDDGDDDDDDEDDDDEDEEDDDKEEGRRAHRRPVGVRRSSPQGVTMPSSSAQERRIMGPTLKALAETSRLLRLAVANQRRLQQQIDLIARAAGLEKHVAGLRIKADDENPAQPIPEPEPASAEDTTDNARGEPEPSGELQDPGSTSETDTSADVGEGGDAGLSEPGSSLDDEQDLSVPDDVTEPVAGTTEMRPTDEVRTEIEPEHRGLDTELAYPESQPLFGEEPQKVESSGPGEARLVLAMRLARARIAAGIAETNDDDLTLATTIAKDEELSDDAIRREVSTLERVHQASRRKQQPNRRSGGRRLVPQQAPRTVPSLSTVAANGGGEEPVLTPEIPLAVTSDEFLFD